ncbi:MAG: YfcE family phosphodiesterase [Patescibacteria group bacterium]|nr:YfcE family phosphodiesterase [Patescibacteria group bacterium]
MKFAIISDSHDNVPNLEKFLAWAKVNDIELIIHCGDLAAPAVIKKIFGPNWTKPFHFIHGNVADRDLNEKVAAEFEHVTCHGDLGELEVDGKKIVFNHYPNEAKQLAASGQYDLVFYGHDHKPWEEKIGQTVLRNPGTLAGMFNKATFAVYDTASDTAKLILLEKI